MAEEKDPPIEKQEFLGGVKVIDIGDLRIARGLSRRPHSVCSHSRLIYDKHERRIWCEDCEHDVESFDAFEILVSNYSSAIGHYNKIKKEALEAKEHNLHLLACREIEHVWRGGRMAPACPHCKGGLLPEDFKPLRLRVSAAIERQRRINKKESS